MSRGCSIGGKFSLPAACFFVLCLVFLPCEPAHAIPELCVALNSHISIPPVIDGFSGLSALEDFGWVQSTCVSNGGSSFTYSSPWQSTPSTGLQVSIANGLSVSNLEAQRSLDVQIDGDTVAVMTITVAFRMTLGGSIDGQSFSNAVAGTVTKSGRAFPLAAASSFPMAWTGSLASEPAGTAVDIRDGDLFDGVKAAVLLQASSSIQDSLQVAELLQLTVADPNLRLLVTATAPSAIVGRSIRGAFLSPTSMPPPAQGNAMGGRLWGIASTVHGTLVQNRFSCRSVDCEPSIATSLQRLVDAASGGQCREASPVIDALYSHMTVELFVSEEAVVSRALGATTQGLFRCAEGGYVGVTLSCGVDPSAPVRAWPLAVFASDPTAVASLTHAIPLATSGRMAGAFEAGGQLFSLLPFDLFGPSRGGTLLPDARLDASARTFVTDALAAARGLLATGVPSLNNAVAGLFPPSAAALFDRYEASSQQPTALGFFQWLGSDASRRGQLQVFVSPDGTGVTLAVDLGVQGEALTPATGALAVQRANSALQTLGARVRAATGTDDYAVPSVDLGRSGNTGALSAFLVASVTVSGFGSAPATPDVSLSTPLTFSATASLDVSSFSGGIFSTNMFTCAYASYDYSSNTVTALQACVALGLRPAVGAVVGLAGSGNQLAVDGQWPNPGALAGPLRAVADQIDLTDWVGGALDPLDLDLGEMADGLRYSEVVRAISESVGSQSSPTTSWGLANSIRDVFAAIVARDGEAHASVHAYPAGATAIAVELLVHRKERVTVMGESSSWKHVLDTARLRVPVLVATRLSFQVQAGAGGRILSFGASGEGRASGWTIPLQYEMLSGTVTQSSARFTLDLPSSATLYMAMDGQTDRGGPFHAEVIGTNLVAHDASSPDQVPVPPHHTITVAEGGMAIAPFRALATLTDGVLKVMGHAFGGALNINVPPLGVDLGAVSRFDVALEHAVPWLNNPGVYDAQLALSNGYCTSDAVPANSLLLNVTVNQREVVQCETRALTGMGSLSGLAGGVNAMLRSCGLSGFLEARVTDVREPEAGESGQCGHIGLFPAVPGIVWDFEVITEDTGSAVQFQGRWVAKKVPAFGNWDDLAWLLFAAFPASDPSMRWFVEPQFTTVGLGAINGSVVAPDMRDVYPEELPAVVLPLHVEHTYLDGAFPMRANLAASGDQVNVNVHEGALTGRVTSSLSVGFVTVFDVPPAGGRGKVSVISNFDGVARTIERSTVPAAPNNTFVFVVGAQQRFPSGDPPVTLELPHAIALPAGKLLRDALLQDLLPQVDARVRPMLKVYETEPHPIMQTRAQVRIDLDRHRNADGSWLVPLFVVIRDSTIPGVHNAANIPPRAAMFAKDVFGMLSADLQASAQAVDGQLALLEMSSTALAGVARFSMSFMSTAELMLISQLFPSRADFFEFYNVHLWVDANAQVSDVNMDDVGMGVDHPDMNLNLGGDFDVGSVEDLDGLASNDLANWRAEFVGSESVQNVFNSIKQLNGSTCTWMQLLDNVAKVVMEDRAGRQLLPFSGKSFGKLLEDGVGNGIAAVRADVCDRGHPLVLSVFCQVLKGVFDGREICQNVVLTQERLSVDLVFVPWHRSYADQFRFDTPTLFGDSFPIGVGAQADLTLMAEFEVNVRLVAAFAPPAQGGALVSLGLDEQETRLSLRANFDFTGGLTASFGPVSARFAGARVWLGSPAALNVRLANGVSVDVVGSAGMEATLDFGGNRQCAIGLGIPDLGGFFNGQRPVQTQNSCGNIAQFIREAIEQNTLFQYFSNMLFKGQWEGGVDGLLRAMFGQNGPLRGVVLPLINRLVERVITEEIRELIGPAASQAIIAKISDTTMNLLAREQKSLNMTFVEDIILHAFTGVICTQFQEFLLECPPTPQANLAAPEYTWLLKFGKTTVRPLFSVDFRLGKHGFASLELQCAAEFVMGWNLTFQLVYSRTEGIRFRFPEERMFNAHMGVRLLPGCRLAGSIGFIGAEIRPDASDTTIIGGVLTFTNRYQAQFRFHAKIAGQAALGFAGKLAEKIAGRPDALDALPHWRARLSFEWNWDLNNRVSVPVFNLTDVQFCVGGVLANVVGTVANQAVTKILDPLEPILGQNGILLRPIPGLSDVFGSDISLVQLIVEFLGDGNSRGILELLETFVGVYQKLQVIRQIAAIASSDQCSVAQAIRDFILDFKNPIVVPQFHAGIPDRPGIEFYTPDANAKREITTKFHSEITTKGKFGIRFYMFDNVAGNLVSAMLGGDFPLAGVTLPEATLSAVKQWNIPIWPWPEISIYLHFGARLTFSFGGVSLMYRGVADAFKTKSPALLFTSLGMPAKHDDGSERWPLSGEITVGGGVEVSIFIFTGAAYFTLSFRAEARLVDIDGDGWVTFAEVAWLVERNGFLGAIDKRIVLEARFGIALRACIKLWFVRKCWDIIKKEWKLSWPINFFAKRHDTVAVPEPGGETTSVNLDNVNFPTAPVGKKRSLLLGGGGGGGGDDDAYANSTWAIIDESADFDKRVIYHYPRAYDGGKLYPSHLVRDKREDPGVIFTLYEGPGGGGLSVDYTPTTIAFDSGKAHCFRNKLRGNTVKYKGNPGNAEFTYSVRYLPQPVVLPNYPTVTLDFMVSDYQPSLVSVTSRMVYPDTAAGVSVAQCQLVHLTHPLPSVVYAMTGVPCPTLIESEASNNVTASGELDAYAGGPIELAGAAYAVDVSVRATEYTISAARVNASSGASPHAFDMLLADFTHLIVTGDQQQGTIYETLDVERNTALKILGGVGDDTFVFRSLNMMNGHTEAYGGAGVDLMHINMYTEQGEPAEATATPSSLVLKRGADGGVFHTLYHTSVEQRRYWMHGAPNTESDMVLIAPERDASVHVTAVGAVGATITQRITGCDGKSEIRVFLTQGGSHVVELGSNNRVTDFRCSLWINGAPEAHQDDMIVVQASEETRPLRYSFLRNSMVVYDTTGNTQWFNLLFEEIEKVVVQFGKGGNVLEVAEGSRGTEFVFDFSMTELESINHARVWASVSPVLLHGHLTEVGVGPQQSPLISVHPLDGITAPIAIAGTRTAPPVRVALDSGTGPSAPAQRYYLDGGCLSAEDGGNFVEVPTKPSEWMCTKMQAAGFPAGTCRSCPVVYVGPMRLSVETGSADDYFIGKDLNTASVHLKLAAGNDEIFWPSVAASVTGPDYSVGDFDLGPGYDLITVTAPTRRVTVALGDDEEADVVDVWYQRGTLPSPPSVHGNVISPVGPFASSSLTMNQLTIHDLPYIRRGTPSSIYNNHNNQGNNNNVVAAARSEADDDEEQQRPPAETVARRHRRRSEEPIDARERERTPRAQSNQVTITSAIPGGVVKYDMDSDTLYRVTQVAAASTVVLNGQGRPADPPMSPPVEPASNWQVLVDLPTPLDYEAHVDVWGSPQTTDRYLTVHVGGTSASPAYLVGVDALAPGQSEEGLGQVVVGGLRVRAAHVDHVKLAAQRPVDVRVDGTPTDADLSVVALAAPQTRASTVEFVSLGNNAVVSGAVVATVSDAAVRSQASVVVSGPGAHGAIDLTSLTAEQAGASYADGCLKALQQPWPTKPASAWFRAEVQAAGVDPQAAADCPLYARRVDTLAVAASHLSASASGLGANAGVRRIEMTRDDSTLFLDENTGARWADVTVRRNDLAVDARFELLLGEGGACYASSSTATPLFGDASQTTLDVRCSDASDDDDDFSPCTWYFGPEPENATFVDPMATYVRWDARYCAGIVTAPATVSPHLTPSLRIGAPAGASVPLTVLFGREEQPSGDGDEGEDRALRPRKAHKKLPRRDIALERTSLAATYPPPTGQEGDEPPATGPPMVSIQWNEGVGAPLTMDVHDGFNAVYLASNRNRDTSQLTLGVHGQASGEVGSNATFKVGLLASTVEVKAEHSALKPKKIEPSANASFPYCLDPFQLCTTEVWVSLRVRDLVIPCTASEDLDKCAGSSVGLVLNSTHSIYCSADDDDENSFSFKVGTDISEWESAAGHVGYASFALAMFFLAVALCFAWVWDGRIPPAGWACIVLTSAMIKIDAEDPSGVVSLLSLVEGTNWVVTSLMVECSRELRSTYAFVSIASVFSALSLAAALLLVLPQLSRFRDSKFKPAWQIARRVATALAVFLLSPFVVTQIFVIDAALETALSYIAFLFLVLVSVVFLFDTCVPPSWRPDPYGGNRDAEGDNAGRKLVAPLRLLALVPAFLLLAALYVATAIARPDLSLASHDYFMGVLCTMVFLLGVVDLLHMWRYVQHDSWKRLTPYFWKVFFSATVLISTMCGLAFILWLHFGSNGYALALWCAWVVFPLIAVGLHLLACLAARGFFKARDRIKGPKDGFNVPYAKLREEEDGSGAEPGSGSNRQPLLGEVMRSNSLLGGRRTSIYIPPGEEDETELETYSDH